MPLSISSLDERIHESLSQSINYLIHRQSPDGAWRSDTYGIFKEGDALTPLIVHTLLALPSKLQVLDTIEKGLDYLAARVNPGGSIDEGRFGLTYPIYTAALAVMTLAQSGQEKYRQAQEAWLTYLKQRQLTENLGWELADPEYGGWGYTSPLFFKPSTEESVDPLAWPNLSATVFALEALASAPDKEEEALKKGLEFVARCQNLADDSEQLDRDLDDGGFFFMAKDAVRNKAGLSSSNENGPVRFRSYGSMTADGLRGLLLCGLAKDHPRVSAAQQWLERNFSATVVPGNFVEGRELVRASVYYYYCWSLAQTLDLLEITSLATPSGSVSWREHLAEELLGRQHLAGIWQNEAVEVREDDPLVATPLAVGALVSCQRMS